MPSEIVCRVKWKVRFQVQTMNLDHLGLFIWSKYGIYLLVDVVLIHFFLSKSIKFLVHFKFSFHSWSESLKAHEIALHLLRLIAWIRSNLSPIYSCSPRHWNRRGKRFCMCQWCARKIWWFQFDASHTARCYFIIIIVIFVDTFNAQLRLITVKLRQSHEWFLRMFNSEVHFRNK